MLARIYSIDVADQPKESEISQVRWQTMHSYWINLTDYWRCPKKFAILKGAQIFGPNQDRLKINI